MTVCDAGMVCPTWHVLFQGVSLLPQTSDNRTPPPPHSFTTMSYSTNHSLLATDLWKQTSCGAEIANHENVLDVTTELPCHFHLPH